jgi:outer membrane protein assembly factor BamA
MQKPYIYAPVPEFNQETQFVSQQTPVDMGDHYFVGIEIHGLTNTDETDELLLQELGVTE